MDAKPMVDARGARDLLRQRFADDADEVQPLAGGEFSRAFSFPGLVDHDGVTATLNNGILSVTVPKTKKPATRRIAIN